MRGEKNNLTTKNISDFKAGDSIYANIKNGDMSYTYECEFIENVDSQRVKVKVLKHPSDHRITYDVGKEFAVNRKSLSLYGEHPVSKRAYYHRIDANGFFYVETGEVPEDDDEIPSEHDSYGMARFSRINSSHARPLFGSQLQHKQTITFSISKGEVKRDLNRDSFFARNEIIEIEMSESQFSQLITTFNSGSGVPCTVRHINQKSTEQPPYKSYADKIANEFENQMHNVSAKFKSSMDSINNILEKKSIGKADREDIKSHIIQISRFLESSLPFMARQFNEQTDDVVSAAKAEIMSFINESARKAGLNPAEYQDLIQIENK